MRQAVDQCVYLPMRGFTESMNIGTTVACVLQHMSIAGALSTPLTEDEVRSLCEKVRGRARAPRRRGRGARPMIDGGAE